MKRGGILDLFWGRKLLIVVFPDLGENRATLITKQKTQREEENDFFFPLVIFPFPPLATLISTV
jgi:hypothetical protein